jgi:hypothetical protein
MPRSYELPGDLTPEEERAVIAALEQALGSAEDVPAPWALAGRMEALRMGALQTRRLLDRPWTHRGEFARRGTEPQVGRGDTR